MLKLILNNSNNINNFNNIKQIIINNSSGSSSGSSSYLFLKSYNNNNNNNNNNINYYSTKSISSLLKNTKRKSSSNRKIKVNHISKNDMNEVLDFQYKYGSLIKRNSFGRSDQATLLKDEFNMDNEEVDDILGKSNNGDEDGDEDGYIEGSNKSKGKIYYSEKITYSTDTSKDNEFIKRSLGNSTFTDRLDGDLEWKEYNEQEQDDENGLPKIKDLKKRELKKKGLEERDGSYYAEDYLITTDYESYFLTPDQPNNRKEKNLFRRLDELKEAKQQSKTKRGFKLNENQNDQFVGQTIVQSRMSSRILEVLNESPLFSPVSFLNSSINDQEFNFEKESDYDNNLKMLEAQRLLGSQVGSTSGTSSNFSLNSDDLQVDQEDPILSKADIILTHAEMSSDLRWVKLYWKRRSHSNVNGGEMKKKSIDDYSKQDALYNINNVENQNIKTLLDSLGTNSAKHLVYDSFKPIINENENKIISSNKFGSKVITKSKYQQQQQQQEESNNNNNNSSSNKNSFGFTNSFSLPNKKVELEISIKESNQDILDKEKQIEKDKQEKREKLLLKILSNTDTDSLNNNSNNNDNDNNSLNNSNNKDIINDPLLQQLTGNNSNNNINNNIQEEDGDDYFDDDKNKKIKKKDDIENRRKKKIRTLFHEITDKDIAHRLLKLKSRIRWIIGKRVQAKFVPDIMFIKDEDEIKDETTIDILDNLVPIEYIQLFNERVKSIEKTRNKLKNKYSSLFYDGIGGGVENQLQDEDDLLDDLDNGEYNKEEEVDLHQVLQQFPSLRREKVVQKFLRYEKERLEPIKQQQQQQQDKELELQQELEQFAQINNNNNNNNTQDNNNQDNTNVQQIFKQFNKDL